MEEIVEKLLTRVFRAWRVTGVPFKGDCPKWRTVQILLTLPQTITEDQEKLIARFVIGIFFDHFRVTVCGSQIDGVTGDVLDVLLADVPDHSLVMALMNALSESRFIS